MNTYRRNKKYTKIADHIDLNYNEKSELKLVFKK